MSFEYLRIPPDPSMREVVQEHWLVRASLCRTAVEAALPDGSAEIYINLGPWGRFPFSAHGERRLTLRRAWVVGPRAHTLLVRKETRECDIVGIRLRGGAISQLLGVPAHEIAGAMIDLDCFWGADVESLRERLALASTFDERVRIIEQALVARLRRRGSDADARLPGQLCTAVARSAGDSLGSIAADLGITHRRLIALFDAHVGLKPKAYQRVQRLRIVMERSTRGSGDAWARIAVRAGYYDQAHMINEFRALTGLTPVEYTERRTSAGHGFVPYRLASRASAGLQGFPIEGPTTAVSSA